MSLENIGKDINGTVDFSLPVPDVIYNTTLAANIEQNITTPANYNRAFFSYSVGTDVFVSVDDTAVLPGTSFALSTSELNPAIRQINVAGGQSISLISDSDTFVSIAFYRSN